ncbi:MAG: efflux RND transporter periplasmic adaptor subunit [Candidatus Choladocola sp.]|nr:efflux RND transporter periplasmic adaptor subunit [Candidatus Choladocola sp.]
MKKALIAVVILGILGAGGYGVYHHFFENTDDTAERVSSTSENAVYVDTVSMITGYGSGTGLIDRYGGEIEPQATLEVKLESDRKVKECYVKEGDEVEEGQKLFAYDTQDDEDKLAQAEIEIERSEGEIEVAEEEIKQYEKEKAKAGADEQLTYTTSILTAQNSIKKSEYEIKTKELEISQLKESIADSVVTAEMAGVVQKISDQNKSDSYSYSSGSDSAYITILAAGDYRVKGTVNEQNKDLIYEGMPMIVYSRVDSSQTWKGMISEIKTDSPEENSDSTNYYSMGSSADSSSYAFYVELENSEGLILGQHVYMEEDRGQDEQKSGIWLEEYYIVREGDQAYVWMADKSNLIEKHEVTLGEYDPDLMEYEITSGLEADDYIALPTDTIAEGMPVVYNDYSTLQDDGFSEDGFDYDMDYEDSLPYEEENEDLGADIYDFGEENVIDAPGGADGFAQEEIDDADFFEDDVYDLDEEN